MTAMRPLPAVTAIKPPIRSRVKLSSLRATSTHTCTGCCGSAACALALAEAGADVVLTARTQEQLDDVAGRVAALGRRAVTQVCDANDTDVHRLLR